MQIKSTCFALLFALVGVGASASTPFTVAIESILTNNASLAARKAACKSDALDIKAENNLADPDVEFDRLWQHKGDDHRWALSVSQSFDWPSIYSSRARAVKAEANAFEQLYLAEYSDLRLRSATALIDYIYARHELKLATEIAANIDNLYQLTMKAHDLGNATKIDLRKLAFERLTAAERTTQAALILKQLEEEITLMNGGQPLDLSLIADYPLLELMNESHYVGEFMAADHILQASKFRETAARNNLAAEKRKALPGFTVGYMHNYEDGMSFNGFKIAITLPVFSTRHRKAAAAARVAQLNFETVDYSIKLRSEVSTLYTTTLKYADNLKLYNEIFPNGEDDDYTALIQKSYEGGQLTILNCIDELNYYLNVRSQYMKCRHDYAVALAALNKYTDF